MTRMIGPVVIALVTGGSSVAMDVLEKQNVSVITAVSIACFVGTACLWLSRKFEIRDEKIQAVANQVELAAKTQADKVHASLECYNLALSQRLSTIEQQIKDMPCQDCRPTRKQK